MKGQSGSQRPAAPRPSDPYTLRILLLLAAIIAVGWAGWYLPRHRARTSTVQALDRPRPQAAPQPPAPPPAPADNHTHTGVGNSAAPAAQGD